MLSPIPSFFKIRLIIAVVPLLLGFFFIGLVHRAFASSCTDGCGACSYFVDVLKSSYSSYTISGTYSDISTLEAACQSDNGGEACDCFCGSGHPWAMNFSWCYRSVASSYTYYIFCSDCGSYDSQGLCTSCSDACQGLDPVGNCGHESNITWITPSTCQFTCTCPDYTGQENYDFDTCTAPGLPPSCDGVSPTPVESCHSEFNIIWTDQATCQFTCKCSFYSGAENYNFETCVDPDCYDEAASGCRSDGNIAWSHVFQGSCEYACKCDEYTGQEVYDFDRCRDDLGNTGCYDEAIAACDGGENVVWISLKNCDYHCVTCAQFGDNCEARYADFGGSAVYCIEDPSTGYAAGLSCEPKECYPTSGDAGYSASCDLSKCLYDITYTSEDCAKYTCSCPPPPDVDSPPQDPEPDPDDNGDNPGDGKNPDPDDSDKTCDDYRNSCAPSCQFACETDFDTGKVKYHNCDCHDDPADPGPDGIPGTPDDGDPGSADDGSNGWLKQIESNTSGLSDGLGEANGWLKAIKHNTDEVLEDTDNISENVRRGLENDKKYFSDSDGVPYLKKINGKLDGLDKLEGNTGTVVGDSDYPLDAGGYGEAPTDDDLPSNEELDASFGTFTPSETPSYISVAESALNSLRPALSSSVCTFDIVFKYESGLVDIDYSKTFNLCQYEAIFNMIGNVLIALASFFNLYKLAFG